MTSTVIVPAVAAETYVDVLPSVLAPGGSAVSLTGLILTNSPRLPTGQVLSFPNDNGTSVGDYFGSMAQETALADIYFLGFNTSTAKPSQLLYSRYAWQQPVNAWLRGGSIAALSLAQLQALSGTLSLTIDGAPISASIDLASATSPSNAAQLIQSALNIQGVPQGIYVGSIAGSTLTVSAVTNGAQLASFTGAISGTTLTVATVNSGTLSVGALITGSGITAGTTISALGSAVCGGVGTYTVNNAQTISSETMTAYEAAGTLAPGVALTGSGITANTYVASLGTGAGGTGTYGISPSQTAASQNISAFSPAVVYDSTSGGIQILSGTLGTGSTITYASGALATSLNLTQATGAAISQGAAQSSPVAAMDAIVALTRNWASFMTTFEPCDPDKESFASWTNSKNNRFHYAMWDTSVLNTEAGGPSPAWGVITGANDSGTSLIYEDPAVDTVGGELAAFVMGYGASINFDATQGRATAAFKSQSGLAPQVFSTAVRDYIIGYGGNCYVDATTSNQAFTFYDNGQVTGPFLWLDSYLNQIWLNSSLQAAFMNLLTQVNSIPYNQAGYGMIAETASGPIAAALNAGVIQPGVPLSSSQIAAITHATGSALVAPIISSLGYYFQVTPATPAARAARQSPGIVLYYTDGGSIQRIVANSIDVL